MGLKSPTVAMKFFGEIQTEVNETNKIEYVDNLQKLMEEASMLNYLHTENDREAFENDLPEYFRPAQKHISKIYKCFSVSRGVFESNQKFIKTLRRKVLDKLEREEQENVASSHARHGSLTREVSETARSDETILSRNFTDYDPSKNNYTNFNDISYDSPDYINQVSSSEEQSDDNETSISFGSQATRLSRNFSFDKLSVEEIDKVTDDIVATCDISEQSINKFFKLFYFYQCVMILPLYKICFDNYVTNSYENQIQFTLKQYLDWFYDLISIAAS